MSGSLWKWRVQLRLELALLFKSWLWMLCPCLYGAWFAYILSGARSSKELFELGYGFYQLQHLLAIGLAMLLGILLLRRDAVNPACDWFKSQPIPDGALITAKYMAGLLYLSVFTAVTAAALMVFGEAQGLEGAELLRAAGATALQFTWSFGVTLALAMLLAACIRGRAVYLIGFCAWMFGTLFMELFIIRRYGFYFLKTFHLSQYYMSINTNWSEVWPGLGEDRTAGVSRLFVAGFTVMLLAAAAAVLKLSRPSAGTRRSLWLAGASMVLASALFLPYVLAWQDRYAGYRERLETAQVEYGEGASAVYAVDSYDIHITRQGKNGIKGTALLRFPRPALDPGQPLYVTLNRSFRPVHVVLNGQAVSWSRDGDWIKLPASSLVPGEQELRMDYEGTPEDWIPGFAERKPMFVEGDELFLPNQSAWYPLPGRQALYYLHKDNPAWLSEGTGIGFPGTADVRLTLEGFNRRVYATIPPAEAASEADGGGPVEAGGAGRSGGLQVFRDLRSEGVTLLSGSLIEQRTADTAFVSGASGAGQGKRFLDSYGRALKYFNSWLAKPAPGLQAVLYFPADETTLWDAFLWNRTKGRTLFIAQYRGSQLSGYELADAVNAALFGDDILAAAFSGDSEPVPSMVGEIRAAFYMVYEAEHSSQPREAPDSPYLVLPSRELYAKVGDQRISRQVEEALKAGRIPMVKRVLNDFYSRGLRIAGAGQGNYPVYTYEDWLHAWSRAEREESGVKTENGQ